MGSIDTKSELKNTEILKIEIELKDAKQGYELLRLLPAKNDAEYEYVLDKETNNQHFEIINDLYEYDSQKISIFTLVIAKQMTQTESYNLKIIGKIKGNEIKNEKLNILVKLF